MPSFGQPSFGSHCRNYSWPPSLHHVAHLPHIRASLALPPNSQKLDASNATLPDIDDDPFAHFISPMNIEDDPDDPMSMSAGIMNTESVGSKMDRFQVSLTKRWAHSITQRRRNSPQYDRPHSQTLGAQLRLSPSDYNFEVRAPHTNPTPTTIPKIVVSSWDDDDVNKDRAQQLILATQRIRRRRRTSRTLSGHRHSWQEPSPDLYTVLEEGANYAVAVESASEDDSCPDDDSDVESLNSEDEALYSEDDDWMVGLAAAVKQPAGQKAKL